MYSKRSLLFKFCPVKKHKTKRPCTGRLIYVSLSYVTVMEDMKCKGARCHMRYAGITVKQNLEMSCFCVYYFRQNPNLFKEK